MMGGAALRGVAGKTGIRGKGAAPSKTCRGFSRSRPGPTENHGFDCGVRTRDPGKVLNGGRPGRAFDSPVSAAGGRMSRKSPRKPASFEDGWHKIWTTISCGEFCRANLSPKKGSLPCFMFRVWEEFRNLPGGRPLHRIRSRRLPSHGFSPRRSRGGRTWPGYWTESSRTRRGNRPSRP